MRAYFHPLDFLGRKCLKEILIVAVALYPFICKPAIAELWVVYAEGSNGIRHFVDVDSVSAPSGQTSTSKRPVVVRMTSTEAGEALEQTYYCNRNHPSYDRYSIFSRQEAILPGTIAEAGRDIACRMRSILLQVPRRRYERFASYYDWQIFRQAALETGDAYKALLAAQDDALSKQEREERSSSPQQTSRDDVCNRWPNDIRCLDL